MGLPMSQPLQILLLQVVLPLLAAEDQIQQKKAYKVRGPSCILSPL